MYLLHQLKTLPNFRDYNMFYTQAEKDALQRKNRRLEEELSQVTSDLLKLTKQIEENSIKQGQQLLKLSQEFTQCVQTQEEMKQEIEKLQKENAILTEANNIKFDNLSQLVDGLNKNQQKATELSLKYFEHATRFEQGKPHAEIISHYIDKEGKLKTELNWNAEFIQNMVKCGFTGKDDKEVIEHWLNSLLYQFREEK